MMISTSLASYFAGFFPEKPTRPIFTLCQCMDQMMGGGVHVGQVTEFCRDFFKKNCSIFVAGGVPGIGKTQLGSNSKHSFCCVKQSVFFKIYLLS